MSAILTHLHVDHSASSPRSSVTSHFNSEKAGSYHLPSIYTIVQFQYTCVSGTKTVNLYAQGNKLY